MSQRGWKGVIWVVCVAGEVSVRHNRFTENWTQTIPMASHRTNYFSRVEFFQFDDLEITCTKKPSQYLVCQEAGKKLAIAYMGDVIGSQPGDFYRFNSSIGITEYA